jgi:hypothetical protein
MRVIRDGVEIWKKCPLCNSILAVLPEDVHDCSGAGAWVTCPVCSGAITVQMREMPDLFRHRVNWDE